MAKLGTMNHVILSLWTIAVGIMALNLYRQDRREIKRTLLSLVQNEEMDKGISANHNMSPMNDHQEEKTPRASIRNSSFLWQQGDAIPLEQQIPRLIIGGAQKGGTTALYNILRRDKQFLWHAPRCRSSPELHFFDWYIQTKENQTLDGLTPEEWQTFLRRLGQDQVGGGLTDQKVVRALRKEYAYCWNFEFHNKNPRDVISFEKTPIYMIIPGLPALIKQVAPWAKILFMIRDPVARAYSSWKMHNNRQEATEDFEFYLNQEIDTLRKQGISNAPTLAEFSSPDSVVDPTTTFQLPHGIGERRSRREGYDIQKSHVYLYRGLYAELLAAWTEHFELGKDLMVVSYERFTQDRLGIVNQIQQFVGANVTNISSKVLESNYHGGYKAAHLNDTTRQYLEHFFQPYNEELAALLGQDWYDYHVSEKWTSVSVS